MKESVVRAQKRSGFMVFLLHLYVATFPLNCIVHVACHLRHWSSQAQRLCRICYKKFWGGNRAPVGYYVIVYIICVFVMRVLTTEKATETAMEEFQNQQSPSSPEKDLLKSSDVSG